MTIDLNGAIGGVITGSSHALPIDALGELADRLIDSDLPIIHPERK